MYGKLRLLLSLAVFISSISSVQASGWDIKALRHCKVMELKGGGYYIFDGLLLQISGGQLVNRTGDGTNIGYPSDWKCISRDSIPVNEPTLNRSLERFLDTHLKRIEEKLDANTLEMQQIISRSYSIQFALLTQEIELLRADINGLEGDEGARLSKRLQALEERMKQLNSE